MRILEIEERSPLLLRQLVEVWENAVRATHLFLSGSEIAAVGAQVPQALREVPRLVVAEREDGVPVAFMGVAGQRLEMLFIADGERGKGLGKQLLRHGMEAYGVRELTVNEQNPAAKGFYEHMGFRVYRRTERDEQGQPYPLLYMKWGP